MTVLFDGTNARPWGKYLDVEPEIPQPAPVLWTPSAESYCARVLAIVRTHPGTRAEISARSGLTREQTKGALAELQRQGLIRSETRESRRCFGGITVRVRYAAVGRWER